MASNAIEAEAKPCSFPNTLTAVMPHRSTCSIRAVITTCHDYLVKCRVDEEGRLVAHTAAYTLVQYVYEHMPAEDVKSHILGPSGGDQVSP